MHFETDGYVETWNNVFPTMLKEKSLAKRIYSVTVTAKENIDLCRDKDYKCAKTRCQSNGIMCGFPALEFVLNMAFMFLQKNLKDIVCLY